MDGGCRVTALPSGEYTRNGLLSWFVCVPLSIVPTIREQITAELGVEPILINSARVSAQNRQRLYWTNIPGVEQPEDRGIVLRDILENGVPMQEKSYTLKANYGGKA